MHLILKVFLCSWLHEKLQFPIALASPERYPHHGHSNYYNLISSFNFSKFAQRRNKNDNTPLQLLRSVLHAARPTHTNHYQKPPSETCSFLVTFEVGEFQCRENPANIISHFSVRLQSMGQIAMQSGLNMKQGWQT